MPIAKQVTSDPEDHKTQSFRPDVYHNRSFMVTWYVVTTRNNDGRNFILYWEDWVLKKLLQLVFIFFFQYITETNQLHI